MGDGPDPFEHGPTSRDPLGLGEVGGVFHRLSLHPRPGEAKVKSSRRGKEQMRSKMSECGREMKDK